MGATRIFALAVEADHPSVDVLRILNELGHPRTSHMAAVSDDLRRQIVDQLRREDLRKPREETAPKPAKKASPPRARKATLPKVGAGSEVTETGDDTHSRLTKAEDLPPAPPPALAAEDGAAIDLDADLERTRTGEVNAEALAAMKLDPASTVAIPGLAKPELGGLKPPGDTIRLSTGSPAAMTPLPGSMPTIVKAASSGQGQGKGPKTPPSSVAAAAEAARAATAHNVTVKTQLPPPRPPFRPSAPRPPFRPHGQGRPVAPRPRPAPPSPIPAVAAPAEPPPITGKVHLSEGVTVKEMAEKLGVKSKEVLKKLMERRMMATINQTLDGTIAKQLARDFGFDAEILTFEEDASRAHDVSVASVGAELIGNEPSPDDKKTPRPPVVTVMGHVDHGKTSLLDAIRFTKVTESESGGITQHIGAYHVDVGPKRIVFLDTPGHEAFTMMRARGAKATDIVILVVAADDGVMPQTIEAIHHAREAKVPILVAINKMDKPGVNIDRVKQQLADHGLSSEDWEGDTVMVQVSAKQRTNLDLLLEMVLLVADMLDLSADASRPASGVVLEAELDKQKGPTCTILVQSGSLKLGHPFIAGMFGKVRAMFDDRGNRVEVAGPSSAVEVLGFSGVPNPGDLFHVVDEVKARQIEGLRQERRREESLQKTSRLSLDHLHSQVAAGEVKELPIILKCDVQGSVEVLSDSLQKLSDSRVKVKIIHSQAGAISVSDVLLASASNAIIFGFNVRPERKAQELAQREQVDIRLHSVIYEIADELRAALSGLLDPIKKEIYLGRADVRDTFKVPKMGMVAGVFVSDGKVTRTGEARLLRDNVVVWTGKIGSLRRFKDDVSEVKNGLECGIGLANYNDVKVADVIEVFMTEMVAQTV